MKKHLDKTVDAVKDELHGVLLFVGLIWAVFIIDTLLGWATRFQLNRWLDLNPRQWQGLVGVFTMPLVHAHLAHIIGNTLPLIALLTLLAGARAKSWKIVASIIVLGGAMTWVIGDGSRPHVGASGLVLGLITFLIATGIFQRQILSLAIAVVVGLLFGGSLFWNLIPGFYPAADISWSGHWSGALAGIVTAYLLAKPSARLTRSAASGEELQLNDRR